MLEGLRGDDSIAELCRKEGNFGVTQQSKDTLRALSELRKAVGDETATLAEIRIGDKFRREEKLR